MQGAIAQMIGGLKSAPQQYGEIRQQKVSGRKV
jgi:hypothetical protein